MYSYAIIIVTYNRLTLLEDCLEHAIHQTFPASAIIVIDNCSTDGTADYLDALVGQSSIDIRVVHMGENVGGAGGFERGLRTAMHETDAEWFMIIDDDAILDYDCMELLEPNPESTTLAYACAVHTGDQIVTLHRRRDDTPVPVTEYSNDIFICDIASFCGLIVSRQLITQIGFPSANYFIWFDDTEYCMRMKPFTPIEVRPRAILNHKVELRSSTEEANNVSWKNYYGIRNSIKTYMKHHHWKHLVITIYRAFKSAVHQVVRGNIKTARLFLSAIVDALFNNMGKNQRYLPGMKY